MLLNRGVTNPDKSLALLSLPLDEVKAVKDAFAVTVNDVVLSLIAGGLRAYLQERGELPDEPLMAGCPVNVRPPDDHSLAGNYFGFMFAHLPTHIAEPVERLHAVHEATMVGKRVAEARAKLVNPTEALVAIPPSNVWALFGRLLARPAAGDRLPVLMNMVISNMMGPPIPLYLAGARIEHLYGRTMNFSGVGMFIHCISYAGSLDLGITSLRELVPDPERIADGLRSELSTLLAKS
jgi:WS/DGAT/MGAT family acyltransferase